ncbi:MAG: hypothetical protein MR729_00620 [Dorea sp.]|nr:hypothetical protein [Dorea sp.]
MSRKNQCVLSIAGLTISFETEVQIEINESFQPFLNVETVKRLDYVVQFSEVSTLNTFPDKWEYEGISYVVASDDHGGFLRMFRDVKRNNKPYAIARYDWNNKHIYVEYLPGSEEFISEMGSCFFHIAWEALLMHEQRIMLHSSCVETPFGGVLFSGPSGVGKSTQADLWCRYGEGRLLNGDRTIIHSENGVWRAYGSPYAGSSRCYVNDSCPICAIVILKQGANCKLRKLEIAEGFQKIFSGFTVNSWDREYVAFACDIAEALASQLPVYELACTPTKNAVRILETELRGRIKR